ncbi:hypothetical protein ACFLTH_10995 [Bacteroidota bacterium]
MLIFLCKAVTEDVKLSEEHVDFKWNSVETVKENLIYHFHGCVDEYMKYFKNNL